jgi:putative FmdB family regulatory protein
LPTYGYACRACKNRFEIIQRITADALKTCESCGGELRRLVFPVGIVFKGSGFYTTDYARKNGAGSSGETAAKMDEKTETKPAEKKEETAPKPSETTASAKD